MHGAIYWRAIESAANAAPAAMVMGAPASFCHDAASVATLLERGLLAWNADEHTTAISVYEKLLGSCGCNSSRPCAALETQAQLTAHGNCGSAHMMRAREPAMAPDERLRHLAVAQHHWSVPKSILATGSIRRSATSTS